MKALVDAIHHGMGAKGIAATHAQMMAAKVKGVFPSFRASLRTNTASRQKGLVAQSGLSFVHNITQNTHDWKVEFELKMGDRKVRHTSHRQ